MRRARQRPPGRQSLRHPPTVLISCAITRTPAASAIPVSQSFNDESLVSSTTTHGASVVHVAESSEDSEDNDREGGDADADSEDDGEVVSDAASVGSSVDVGSDSCDSVGSLVGDGDNEPGDSDSEADPPGDSPSAHDAEGIAKDREAAQQNAKAAHVSAPRTAAEPPRTQGTWPDRGSSRPTKPRRSPAQAPVGCQDSAQRVPLVCQGGPLGPRAAATARGPPPGSWCSRRWPTTGPEPHRQSSTVRP